MAAITKRIAGQQVDITIEAFAQAMTRGQSFAPAYFTGDRRTNDTWAGQQLFALDFDDGITLSAVLERCEKYGMKPCFIYETFSSVNQNKFRVIFANETDVRDYRIRNVLQLALMRMFKESDIHCKDASRFFAGGKGLLYENYEARINVVDLVNSLCRFISDTDKNNHATREINNYCQSVGLDMRNGLPKIAQDNSYSVNEGSEESKIGEITTHPIYNTLGCDVETPKTEESSIDPSNTVSVVVRGETYNVYFCSTNVSTNRKQQKHKVINEKIKREYLRRFDFSKLSEECKLWKDFSEGDIRLDHGERFGIATNLLCVEGGRERFISILKEYEELHEYDVNKWEYQCNQIVKLDYAPMCCNNFCPYTDTCEHAKNMLEQAKTLRGRVTIISEPEYITIEQAEKDVREAFEIAMKADDKKVHVIKAATGIGKTELYLDVRNVTIALPTHKLKSDVAERMANKGNKYTATPALPGCSEEHSENIKKLYDVGAYSTVNAYIRNLASKENIPEFIEYLKQLEKAKNSHGTILTTHERVLYFKDSNSTIIIDEDILPTLLKVDSITLEDLNTVVTECMSIEAFPKLKAIQQKVNQSGIGIVEEMPSYFLSKRVKLEKILINHNRISTNVTGFLNCDHFVKELVNDRVVIYFVNKRQLPDKKVIILSASADETMYRLMFGDRLAFTDIGAVETIGQIQQYPERSFSRTQMKDNAKLVELAKSIVKDAPAITYKSMSGEFSNCVATFGATAGLDIFGGMDIAVIGTPHVNPITYLLIANALGQKPRMDDSKSTMEYTRIKRNGFLFYFNTFSDDDILRNIQLYLIESELIQAVGRARILRNDCTVTLLSNFPLQGANFVYLTKEQLETLRA